MLKIILAYKGYNRRETPELLYAGHSGTDAQTAVNKAPEGFVRFSCLSNPVERKMKRQAPEAMAVDVEAEARISQERRDALLEFASVEDIKDLNLLSYSDEQFLELLSEYEAKAKNS